MKPLAVSETHFANGGQSYLDIARDLSETFAGRASLIDEHDHFVAENYQVLRETGLSAAGVPAELGGGGLEIPELCEILRTLAHGCGSTALAFSMHTHQVAVPAWRWRHKGVAAVEPLLRRIAAEKLILLSSGGSDWIPGSGKAEKVDGGYRITARKVFTSGAEAGNILMTGAIHHADDGSEMVVHFGAPMNAPEIKIIDTWRTLGMRGTGSNDVVIDGLFVPDASVAFTRKAGEWHPVFQIIASIAFPLVYSVYLGVAERARDLALEIAKKKTPNAHAINLAGRMETALRGAQLAHRSMVEVASKTDMSAETVNEAMIGRPLVARHGLDVVELAMELAGGASFYRANQIERCFRDMQAARFHPLQEGPQAQYAGSIALGLPIATVF